MADEANKDLAVLGFRVESNNAVNIINGVTQALKNLDTQAKITDAALEQKITAALTNMAEAARSLGSSKATEGIHNFTSAIEELTKTKDFAGIIKGGVEALRSSGFETLAKNYGQALTSLSNVFTSTDNTIKGAVAGLQRSASGAIKDRDITSIRGYVNILEDAMAQLNLFIEKPKKIPEGISKNDVEAARDNMKAMMVYVRQYMSAIENASQGENKKNHEARWARDAQLAISEVTRTYNDFQKQYQTLLPGTLQTLQLHAVIDNIDEVMAKLHPSVDVKIDTASVNSIGSLVTSLEKLKTMDVSINVPTAAINSMRTQIMKAFENEPLQVPIAFTIGSKVVSRTVTAKDQGIAPVVQQITEDAKKAGAETKKAKISIEGLEQDRKEFLDDLMSEVEEFDDLSKKWFPKGQDLLTPLFNEAMAGGEDQLKKLKGILTKIGYEKEGIQMFLDQTMPGYKQDDKEPPKIELPKVEPPKETETVVTEYETSFQNALEKLKGVASSYTSDLTHLITFHPSFLFTEEDERKSKEALQKLAGLLTSKKAEKLANAPMLGAVNLDAFTKSLSDAQDAYDALVAHIDLEENMPHLSFAKNTPGGGFMTQLNTAFEAMTAKPKNITVAPEHITVDRSDAVMKFQQNDIVMPVDDLTIAPSVIYIDNKALANIAKGSFDNIVLPMDNISLFPKTVSVVTTTAEAIKADQNTIEAVIKSATLMPQAVKFDLSQAAKKDLLVKSKIKIAPTAATVDSEAAKQIVGTSKTAIKIQSKISLDPLPSDEIEKMGLLVTQINNVDTAYGMLLRTVTALRDTVRETEGSMSKELRGLIKGEQHKAEAKIKDPEKAAAADAEKIKKQAEAEQAALDALAKAQAELQELHKRYQFNPEQNSQNRQKEAKEALDLSKKLEDEAGKVATNRDDRQQSYLKVETQFKATLSQKNETVQELTKNLKAEATAMRNMAKVDAAAILNTAKAEAAMRGFSTSVTTAGIEIVKLGRIIPTSLVDPFKQARAELGETGSRLVDFGRMFGLYFSGRTVINYFRQAAESANAFGMEIRRIQSLATDFDFTNLRNELMDIDARFGNVIHNANALYWAYSSGVRGTEKELANFVEIMSKTSTTIKSDIMPTVDAATSIMNAWNLSAGSAAEIGDLLFSIIKYGKSNAQQLTTSLGHVVAPAAALNVNLDELGATIATLTKTMKTNRALTYLSNILGKMASPTKQVQEAAAEMGIELSATAIKARGFAQTLADIRRVTGGDIGKIAKLFPDLRGQRAAITLLSTQYKDFEQQLENMRGKAGAMEEALGKITDTPEAQLKAIRNTISMISIGAGDAVNTTITLGGLLGPILEKINKMEHGGRELLGHLTASVGATVGLAVASRALAAAQFGAAQAAYQMAAAANETHKVELSNALLAEKRLIDEKGLAVAALKRELSEKKNNDDLLRSLREQAIAMKDQSQQARQRLTDAKQTLSVEDQMLKRRMEDRAVAVGTSRTRIASLGSWLNDLQTGDAQKKLLADINLVKRLQADISISQATLSDEEAQLVGKYRNIIQPLVEQETEARKRMMEAMESGDVESFENQKSFLNYILSQIKTNTGISGQMAQYDTQGRLLEQETRRVMLAEMQKGLVAGQNYEHSLLIQFVEDEIKTEKTKLATLQSDLDVLKQNHATNDEIRTQLDAITKQTAVVNELDAKRLEIQTQIEQRERSLTGRGQEQLQILSNIQKEAQQKLQLDMEDVENLQKNLDIEMRRASFIGGATLEATKASVAARMQEHNVVLQLNTLERERETLIDKEGNLINESAEAAERVAAIDKERVELQSKLVKLQQQYIDLGIKAGSERARNMHIAGWNGELDGLVKSLARDRGVVKEAVKAMSTEVGKGIFGGRLGGRGMQGLAIASTMIPGLGRYGMGASMLASMNVFGKAASGMTRLTASVMKLMGTTERLQKNGVMSMTKGVEDLTKSLMTSLVWTKKQALANKALMGLAGSGAGSQAAMAGAAASATWWTAGLGIGGILAGAIISGMLLYINSEKGGPLGDLAESLYGVDDKKRRGDFWDARQTRLKEAKAENDEMIRSMQRISASLPFGSGDILEEQLSTIHESISEQVVDGNTALLDVQNVFMDDLRKSLRSNSNEIAILTNKRNNLQDQISFLYDQYGKQNATALKYSNEQLYQLYYDSIGKNLSDALGYKPSTQKTHAEFMKEWNSGKFRQNSVEVMKRWNAGLWQAYSSSVAQEMNGFAPEIYKQAAKDARTQKNVKIEDIPDPNPWIAEAAKMWSRKQSKNADLQIANGNLAEKMRPYIERNMQNLLQDHARKMAIMVTDLETDLSLGGGGNLGILKYDKIITANKAERRKQLAEYFQLNPVVKYLTQDEYTEYTRLLNMREDIEKATQLAQSQQQIKQSEKSLRQILNKNVQNQQLIKAIRDTQNLRLQIGKQENTQVREFERQYKDYGDQIKQLTNESQRLILLVNGKFLNEKGDIQNLPKQMIESIQSAMTPIPQDMIQSADASEKKIRATLDKMGQNIQAQIEFDISVSQYQQKEMQRINTAIAGLKKGNTARTYFIRKQEFTDTLNKINQEIEVWAEVAEGLSHNPMRQEDLANARFNLRDARERRAKVQQMINNLGNDGYDDFLSGVAEARYQNLREVLEADRDAAFAPLQDSGRKLELAKKMTNMAFNRLSYVLGNGKELADLTSKTGEDIQEMVRSIVADLSTPMQKIKDEYDLYNEGLQKLKEGTDPYNEQKAKVEELQTKLDAAQKEYQEKTEGIRSALQDFYNREANEVSAYIQDVMEQIKRRTSKAKYFSMFQKGFGSLKVQEENISQLLKVSETLDKEYTSKTGMFARLSRLNPMKAKETYEGEKRQVDDAVMQYRQSYLEMLRGVGESTASLMENIASDLQTSQKSFFEFQLNDPRNAGIQGKLINQQYGLIGSLLYGKNGVIAMRNKALEDAKAFMGAGDEQEALKALGEAQKYQQKQVGYEQQRLGLVKLKADKEKEINQSLFSLASTLQGKFESTSQTAVDAYSEEAIRLQMRRIGENIAPPVQTSAQELERQMMRNFYQENAKSYTMLMQVAEKLQNQIATRSQNADILGGAASTMERASDTAKVAAETFKRTVESNKTTFRIKRI